MIPFLNIPAWIYIIPIVFINVLAGLLLKSGAMQPNHPIFLNLLSIRSFLGLLCFGLGGLAYAWALRYVPLSIAQAILASQYVFVLLGAWLIFQEPIDSIQFAGFIFVGIGIALIISR